MRSTLRLAFVPFLPLLAVACGGGPDIEQVKKDFQSPSGSVGNKEAVVAANGKRDAGGPAIAVAGGGVPGAALTAAGTGSALEELNAYRTFADRARSLNAALRSGKKEQALRASQATDIASRCSDSEIAREAYNEMLSDLFLDAINPLGGDLNGSADYELDLATCSEGQLTGRLEVEIEVTLAEDRFAFKVTEDFDNVCEVGGVEACVSGTLIMEAAADNTGSDASNFNFVTAWELDTRWNDHGTPREASVSAGLRIGSAVDGMNAVTTVEYLFYVTPPDGDRISYVFRLTADEMGNATIEIRGADGSLSCSIMTEGGTCTSVGGDGTATLTWTRDEAAGLSSEYYED